MSSGIDELFQQGRDYRDSSKFREMIEFIARFRKYAPYNNMLVKLQNPDCTYYATQKVWKENLDRTIKEDQDLC